MSPAADPATALVPPPGPHGDDGRRVAETLGFDPGRVLDLSATLNPLAPDPARVVAPHLGALRAYPDDAAATSTLAAALDADPARLVLTNGGAEAIALVAAVRPDGWIDGPEFSLYARHLASVRPGAGRWRSNPHSPTGLLADPTDEAAVWDEAFYPLATGTWTRGDADAGAVVVGSLTKVFACPGLRLGYVLAPERQFAAAVAARRPRWSVNGLALAALPDLLAAADLPGWSGQLRSWGSDLADALRRRGLAVWPGAGVAPWVVAEPPAGVDLRARLALRGVLVRALAGFGFPGAYRLAVPAPDGARRLLAAVDDALDRPVPAGWTRPAAASTHEPGPATRSAP